MKLVLKSAIFTAVLALFLFAAPSANASACVSNATGNWDAAGTWTACAGGIPLAADTVVIGGGFTVTVNISNAVAASIQVASAGPGAGTLVFNAGSNLTVSGAVSLGGTGPGKNGTITMTNGGTLTAGSLALGSSGIKLWTPGTGTLQLTATNTVPAATFNNFNNLTITAGTTTLGAAISVTGTLTQTGNIAVGGNTLTVSGTHIAGTSTVSGAGGYTLAAGATLQSGSATGVNGNITTTTRNLNIAANYTFDGSVAQVTGAAMPATVNNLTINNAAGVTLSATMAVSSNLTVTAGTLNLSTFTANRAPAGGTLTIANGATLKIGGTNPFPTNYTTHSIGATSTVEYSGTTQSVSVLNSGQSYGNLTISGSLTKTLAGAEDVAGDLTIASGTFSANNSNIAVGGSWINNGSFTAGTGRVTFSGAGIETVTGTSTTAFNTITINKGTDFTSNILDVQSLITMTAGGLTLTNGTFKLSSASTITVFTADIAAAPYLIPATAGLWVNGGTVAATSDLTPAGLIRVSNGTFNLGNAADERLFVSWATVIIEGGAFNISGRWTRRIPGEGAFVTMTGGVLTVGTVGNTDPTYGSFTLDAPASTFTMSGGTIVIRRPGGSAPVEYTNLAGTSNVTGGTLQIGDASTPAASIIPIDSTVPLWDLTINGANSPQAKIVTDHLTVKNNVTITSGTIDSNDRNITVGGNWINNVSAAAFSGGTGTVIFNGAAAGGSIGGTFATTFKGLTMNRANGLTLGANITAAGLLTFTSGNITTGTNNLYLSSTGTFSRTSGHVIGNFRKNVATGATSKTFEIGDAGNYTPVTVLFGSVTTAGDLTASTASGDHANIGTSIIIAAKSVNRNWTLTNGGIVFTTYGATFTFVAGDVDGGASTAAFIVGKYSGGWIYPTVGTKTALTTQTTGLTTFGGFQLGEAVAKTWDGGAGTNNWGDAANWNADGVPISTDNVDLIGANTININVAAVVNNLLLNNAGLTLTINSGNSLAVSGALTLTSGTLNMGANTISGAGSFTLGSGGNLGIGSTAGITSSGATGNVQVSGTRTFGTGANYTYNGTSAQATGNGLPATVNSFTVNNSAGVTLNGSVAVSSNLTVATGTLDLGIFTANRTAAGGTLSVANGATLKIGGTNTFPSNFSTHVIGATSTVEYGGTAQTVAVLNGAADYGHLTISGSGTKTLAGAENIAGDLTVSAGTFDLGVFTANRATAGGTLTVVGGATLKIGGTNPFPTNFSTHSIGFASTIEYGGTNQTVTVLNSAQDYSALTISGSGTKTLAGDVNVAGILTLTSGTVTTGAYTIYSKLGGNVISVSGWVIGNLKRRIGTGSPSRIFDVGDAASYTPVTVVFNTITTGGDLTISTAAGDHANIGTSTINAAKSVNRNWSLTNSGIVFATYSATFTFVPGDVDSGANTAAFVVGKYGGAAWTYPTVGTRTATTTQATGLTSFSDFQLGEIGYSISGAVFEDKNYGGGAGRSLAASSGVVRSAARVELYNSGGAYQAFATTDGSGNYTFSGLVAGTYTVRVANASVTTSRGVLATTTGTQTFRTDASSGAAVPVTDHVGGETPGLLDAFDGSTTLAALTTGTNTPQSITTVALSSGNVGGVDFGYNFNVVTNANTQGQGSLRRALIYANAMPNAGLAQSGLTAGIDNIVFMLADGTARPGLTASYATQFTGGVATVVPALALPTITDPIVIDATLQPGYAGVPMIELNGSGAGAGVTGLTITAGGSSVRGLVINRFTVDGISLSTAGSNTITGNYIGTNAAGTAASANGNAGITISSAGNVIGGTTAADRNVLSGNTGNGVTIDAGTGNFVRGNYIGTNAAGTGTLANGGHGVYLFNGAGTNTIGGTAAGAGNLISGNAGKGVVIATGTGNAIRSNSMYGNSGIGIDLTDDGVTANNGTKSGAVANSDMDTPVFTTTTLAGTTLTIAGYVGSAAGQATFAGASVEVFKSDLDSSGFGEGRTYLGTLTANASGNFSGTLTVGLVVGDRVTGTATDAAGNTSEFGANAAVTNAAKTWDGGAGTNNWGDAANWNVDGVPISTDNVSLTGANTININVAAVVNTLVLGNAGLIVTMNPGSSLAVSGAVTLTSGTLNMGTGTINGTGSFTVGAGGNLGIGSTAGITSSGATGNVQVSGTRSFSTGANYTYNGTSAQVTGSGLPAAVNNLTASNTAGVTLSQNVAVGSNLTVTAGTLDLGTYTANRATTGGTLTVSNNATLKVGGTNTYPTNYTANTLAVASTVEYSGTNQAVANQTYGNLKLSSSSGAAVKTLPGTALSVVGNLTSILGAGSSVSFTAASNITVGGSVSIGASTTFNGGSYSHSIGTNWSNSGTFNGNTGTVTLTGSGASVSGAGAQNFNNLTIAASAVTFSNVGITLTGNLATTGSGSFSQASGGTLSMAGAGTTISGTGIALDNLTVSGSVTTATSLNLTGNLSVSGSFTSSTGTITMSGASKTISGAGTKSFGNLSVSGSITTATDFSISSGLSVNGSLSASAGTATFTGTSTLSGTANLFNATINGTSLQLSSNSTLGVAGALTITAGTLNVTTSAPNTVNFNGTGAQNINAITYDNLILSNGNNKTAIGGITVNNNITIGAGTTFVPGAFTHSIYKNWTNNGSFTAGSSTIQFVGPQTGNIVGATTFNILTVNSTTAATGIILQSNVSASTVNMTLGTIHTGANTITITTTRTGNGIIMGNIQRTHAFTTGVAYAFEGPDNTITFSSVSSVTSVTVSVVPGVISDFPGQDSVNRLYTVSVPAGTYNATLRLHYEDNELDGNDEPTMTLWNYNGAAWGSLGKTGNSTTSNYVELSGLTNITDRWTMSGAAGSSNIVRWNGSVSTDWNTANNWTIIQGGASRPPAATDIVELGTAAFTNQPTISSTVTVRNINFGSVEAVTLSMASGSSLALDDLEGSWSSNVTHTINVNGQSITLDGDLTLSDGVSGHAINLNIGSGTVNVGGSLNQSGGANIVFSGAGALSIGEDFGYVSGTFTPGTGTVTYSGASNQAVAAVGYNNLIINKSGASASINDPLTIGGNLTVTAGELDNFSTLTIAGNVTISSGATLRNHSIVRVGGNWANSGSFIGAGTNVIFNGNGTQTISASTFNNLEINKPAGTAVLTADLLIGGNLVVTAGTLDLQTYFITRDVVGGFASIADGSTAIIGGNNGPVNFAANTLGSASTVIYNGTTAQYISSDGIAFGNLIFRNAGTKTLITPLAVNGDLTIDSGSGLDGGAQTITLMGNWVNNGSFTPSAGTVVFAGTGKNISGTTTLNNGVFSGSYTALSDVTYNGLFNVTTTGSFIAGTGRTITFSGDLATYGNININGSGVFTGNILQTVTAINATVFVLSQTFNGTVSPVFNTSSSPQFGIININNTAGINPSDRWTILAAMNIGAGASFNGGAATHTFLGSLTNNGTITSSGTLDFLPPVAKTINLGGSFSSTGTVNFGGAGAITLAGTNPLFFDVRISNTNAAGITPSYNWTIADNFVIDPGSTLNAGGYIYRVGGNLANNGTINSGTSTFTLNGTGPQDIYTGSAFNNLTINKAAGIATLSSNATVNGILNFTVGNIQTGSNRLIQPASGTVTGAAQNRGWVNGNLQKNIATGPTSKVFEVGGASYYTPVAVAFGNVTSAGDLTANVVPGDHNSIGTSGIAAAKTVNRHWTLTNSGVGFTNYNATFTFVAGDVDAGANTGAFIVGKYSGGSWTHPAVGTQTSLSTQATGLTSFSDFQIGEAPPPNIPLLNSVLPAGTQPPGTDLVYTVIFTNDGGQAAQVLVVDDPVPANTDFKVGSAVTTLGTTGLTVTITYSNNNGVSYVYTPVSATGGAPSGYDRTVTNIRWTFGGNLSPTSPNNAGSVSFTAQIR